MIDPLIFKLSVQLTHLSILDRPGFSELLLQSSYTFTVFAAFGLHVSSCASLILSR